MTLKVVEKPVADIIREFADALDSELCRESLAKIDPMRQKLTALLDAMSKYMEGCGVHGLSLASATPLLNGVQRNLTDELRRFADALQQKHDVIRLIDHEYKKLSILMDAIRVWMGWLGIDLGIGGGFVAANPVLFPNAKRRLLKGTRLPGRKHGS